jgi:hypothetical protein
MTSLDTIIYSQNKIYFNIKSTEMKSCKKMGKIHEYERNVQTPQLINMESSFRCFLPLFVLHNINICHRAKQRILFF